MHPIIRPLRQRRLTEEEFYALGEGSPTVRVWARLRYLEAFLAVAGWRRMRPRRRVVRRAMTDPEA